MKKPLEDILDICLEKMKQGASIEDVVKHHPEQAEELKNLLVTAADIKKANSPIPRKKAVAACLKKVRTEAAREKAGLSQKNPPFRFLFFSPAWVKAAAVFLIVVLLPWGTVNLSAESLPGDILYPVKMITEKVRYICCMTAQGKVKLRLQYSEERMKELYRFSSEKRQLDKNLLKSMLDEAGFALDQMNRIAAGLRRGSRQAWSALYETYAERLWREVARLMGGNAADVADVVQEVFLAAARSAGKFDRRIAVARHVRRTKVERYRFSESANHTSSVAIS